MQNNNNIQPPNFPKNLSWFFLQRLLQGLFGVNSLNVIYCLLLLTLT